MADSRQYIEDLLRYQDGEEAPGLDVVPPEYQTFLENQGFEPAPTLVEPADEPMPVAVAPQAAPGFELGYPALNAPEPVAQPTSAGGPEQPQLTPETQAQRNFELQKAEATAALEQQNTAFAAAQEAAVENQRKQAELNSRIQAERQRIKDQSEAVSASEVGLSLPSKVLAGISGFIGGVLAAQGNPAGALILRDIDSAIGRNLEVQLKEKDQKLSQLRQAGIDLTYQTRLDQAQLDRDMAAEKVRRIDQVQNFIANKYANLTTERQAYNRDQLLLQLEQEKQAAQAASDMKTAAIEQEKYQFEEKQKLEREKLAAKGRGRSGGSGAETAVAQVPVGTKGSNPDGSFNAARDSQFHGQYLGTIRFKSGDKVLDRQLITKAKEWTDTKLNEAAALQELLRAHAKAQSVYQGYGADKFPQSAEAQDYLNAYVAYTAIKVRNATGAAATDAERAFLTKGIPLETTLSDIAQSFGANKDGFGPSLKAELRNFTGILKQQLGNYGYTEDDLQRVDKVVGKPTLPEPAKAGLETLDIPAKIKAVRSKDPKELMAGLEGVAPLIGGSQGREFRKDLLPTIRQQIKRYQDLTEYNPPELQPKNFQQNNVVLKRLLQVEHELLKQR